MTMNIYQRLNKVREKVSYLKKDKKVEQYNAITHDAVTAAVRPYFIEFGVVVSPSLVEERTVEGALTHLATKSGTPIIRYEAIYEVSFINMDDPQDRHTMRVSAHALDNGDKAPGKTASYATKYAMLKVLSIETGEDEEGRQQFDSAKVAELRNLVKNEDAEGLFDLRYSMSIEEWNAVTGHARESAEKKRDWDNMVKRLLEQAEETLGGALVSIREFITADDDMGAIQQWDELARPQQKYIWNSLEAHERAFLKKHATPEKRAA